MTLRIIDLTMKGLGYDTVVAKDGAEGIKYLEEENYDLLVTDINMPYNSGLELLQYLRNGKEKKIPVIIVSNIALEETKKHALELGASRFITKPFDPEDLREVIRSLKIS